ncbi:hypothetical protein DWY46_04705 [Blautia obeum]|jgi:transcriptional regulator NrdR family protein|uniref:Transcriptional repressor NrdR-like N-terminal domain-containing protein n=1 Tax=Blautia obeum TaxID=40520 RepID=A0A411ZSZ4_9FIRM|nr:hypothetical protein DWZ12_05610 [Blautia obeum]RGR50690.1 hypothetical protein DWY46_04705 [Blautia obeum]
MICPRCGEGRAVVKDTRDVECGEVKRFRKCDKCGYIFHTYEITEDEYFDLIRIRRKYLEETGND